MRFAGLTTYRAGMVMLLVADCAFLAFGIIIPVMDGVIPITQFAPLVLSAAIALALAAGDNTNEQFNDRRYVYLTLTAVLVAIGAVSTNAGLTSTWISSISVLLLLVLVSIVVDKKKNASHEADDRK